MTVRALKRREAAHIKRLEEVRRMGWHAESNDAILCTVLVELWCSVAAVAVYYEKTTNSICTRRCMSIKVLYLPNAELIYYLVVV